jgi:hypothetical protein
MKRASRALVAYSSSEDEPPADAPERKKKKLPSLALSLIVPAPVDNPALHQGRVRATPHVEGQYATYVYIPLVVRTGTALCSLVDEALDVTKEMVPAAHTIGENVSCSRNSGGLAVNSSSRARELHLSLTRPIFLRAHQREEFKQAIKLIASRRTPFQASFATFSELTNDERTRAFLSLEVGAGHNELRDLLSALSPTLQFLRQRDFYSQPRFHVSIAWTLLGPDKSVNGDVDTKIHPCAYEGVTAVEGTSDNLISNGDIGEPNKHLQAECFPRVPHFPSELIPTLNRRFGARLSSAHIGGFYVDTIVVKIGKDIFSWPFQGFRVNRVNP